MIPLDIHHVQSWPKVGPFVGCGLYIRVLYINVGTLWVSVILATRMNLFQRMLGLILRVLAGVGVYPCN